jgi:hypothetical protein
MVQPMAKKAGRKSTTSPARILRYQLSPDEFARLKKDQADLDRVRKAIDRPTAIRDNLIPPPWTEKLITAATEGLGARSRSRRELRCADAQLHDQAAIRLLWLAQRAADRGAASQVVMSENQKTIPRFSAVVL